MGDFQGPVIRFHISPFLNLYYSLEVATGSVKEAYNEEYAKRMKEIFPENILKSFARLSERQSFSWMLKSCLFDEISQSKLEEALSSLARDYYQVLGEAFSSYQEYWEKAHSNLRRAKAELEEVKEDYQALIVMASDMANIPLKMKKLDIYILDAPTGESINDNAIGYGVSLQVPFFLLILHETMHILVGQTIRVLSRKYTNDEHAEYIDEAIVNLITNSVFSRLEQTLMKKFVQTEKSIKKLVPPLPLYSEKPETVEGQEALQRHDKRNRYIKYYRQIFENDWTELMKQKKDFDKLIITLLERNMDKIKRG